MDSPDNVLTFRPRAVPDATEILLAGFDHFSHALSLAMAAAAHERTPAAIEQAQSLVKLPSDALAPLYSEATK